MIRRLGWGFTRLSHRYVPHPFVFALLLTLVTFALGALWARATPTRLLESWYEGFWSPPLMVFALQMALILVTGHALAETGPVQSLLRRLTRLVRGTVSAVALTSSVAMLAALLNWGLGLIVGALLARTIGRIARREGVPVHYPLVVAAGYTGLLVWHGGLSGSAPVSIATPGHPLESEVGIIPINETLLTPLNLVVTGFLLVAVPLLLGRMAPKKGEPVVEASVPRPEKPSPLTESTPAQRLERGRLLPLLIVIAAAAVLVPYFVARGWSGVNLNAMIFCFLAAGMLLHGSPIAYARSVDGAVAGAGGILLQFPFYFGIMGVMRGTGLVERMAELFVSWTDTLAAAGLPASSVYADLTFLSAGLVNLFVPSGGGQWAVQGPIAVEAAARLGSDLPTVVMALAYGDQLTNMLQPFWALPLLAITGLHAREIVGYTAALMFLVTVPLLLLLAVLAG